MEKVKPLVLMILDGWGHWEEKKGNPIAMAELPTFDKLDAYYPKTLLQASGLSVGLPWGVYGNSEVGHQTLGTGQVIYQYLPTIVGSIQNGSFFKNETLLAAVNTAKENGSKIHLMGLLSDGGVHSHINHLIALLEFFQEQEFQDVFVHAITDGRDAPPRSAKKYFTKLYESFDKLKVGKLASMAGRYYTMDRNENWDRVEKGYLAFLGKEGRKEKDVFDALDFQYSNEKTDEFFEPVIFVDDKNEPIANVDDGDVVIFFNFRKDRARQIASVFAEDSFVKFDNKLKIPKVKFVCFAKYQESFDFDVVFPPQEISMRIGEIISENKMKQFRIAETEKYAHVTYFFNGGLENAFEGEDRKIIPSKKVDSYAEIPEMSAQDITDELISVLDKDKYDFILVNYANPDMVGHTGNLKAGVKAVEFVDSCVDKVIKKVLNKDGSLIITADHGNVEEMINLKTGSVDTEHSINPVPCWFVTAKNHRRKSEREIVDLKVEGMIVDVPPTILDILGLKIPDQMVGDSLLSVLE